MTLKTVSTSSAATEKLAEQLGKRLRGSEVIELVSDLGGGKTTFVRGLARGMGSTDKVSSPSFTISHEYVVKDKGLGKLVHLDFYRLQDAGLMIHELQNWLNDPAVVVVVEWADIITHVLLAKRLTIKIKVTGEETRQLNFECSNKLNYLQEGLC